MGPSLFASSWSTWPSSCTCESKERSPLFSHYKFSFLNMWTLCIFVHVAYFFKEIRLISCILIVYWLISDVCMLYFVKDGWEGRWVKSDWKKSEGAAGDWLHTAGKWHGDPEDKGICFLFYIGTLHMLVYSTIYVEIMKPAPHVGTRSSYKLSRGGY